MLSPISKAFKSSGEDLGTSLYPPLYEYINQLCLSPVPPLHICTFSWFVSPVLYVVHSFYDGLSFLVADLLKIRIGNTFSGGFIDFFLFGIMQGNAKTNWLLVLPVGAAWACLYYFTFRFAIAKFNIATPGRGEDDIVVNEPTPKENKNMT